MYVRASRWLILLTVLVFGSCSGRGGGTTESEPGSTSETVTGSEPSTGTVVTTTGPWGEEYEGHYKPPTTGCLADEAEAFAGLGRACLPTCIDGLCPPAAPGTSGAPACEVDLDDSIPGPDHCVITCSEQADCQGEGYTCKGGWCSWP